MKYSCGINSIFVQADLGSAASQQVDVKFQDGQRVLCFVEDNSGGGFVEDNSGGVTQLVPVNDGGQTVINENSIPVAFNVLGPFTKDDSIQF